MSNLKQQTPNQLAQFANMIDVMQRLEWDMHNTIEMTSRIPKEWDDIAARRPMSETIRVNLRLEKGVVRFFKSMGA
jgi:hypothetical protein